MPEFDLRYVRVAKYNNTAGTITYAGSVSAGEAMEANLELKFAEGRIYAEGSLSEYLKRCTGGTISLATKRIPDDTKKLMYGFEESTTNIKVGTETKSVKGLSLGKNSSGAYVGTAFVAPDRIDGADKFTCAFVAKTLFGPPAMKFKSLDGSTITFQTPTTSGEFLADDSTGGLFIDTATLDSYDEAVAWVDAKLPKTAA